MWDAGHAPAPVSAGTVPKCARLRAEIILAVSYMAGLSFQSHRCDKKKSFRNLPWAISFGTSLFVAATISTSACLGVLLPRGVYSPSCSTRNSLGLSFRGEFDDFIQKRTPSVSAVEKPVYLDLRL
jgi:hypothetical protein